MTPDQIARGRTRPAGKAGRLVAVQQPAERVVAPAVPMLTAWTPKDTARPGAVAPSFRDAGSFKTTGTARAVPVPPPARPAVPQATASHSATVTYEFLTRYCRQGRDVRSAMVGELYPSLPVAQRERVIAALDADCDYMATHSIQAPARTVVVEPSGQVKGLARAEPVEGVVEAPKEYVVWSEDVRARPAATSRVPGNWEAAFCNSDYWGRRTMLVHRYHLTEAEANEWMFQDFDRQCDSMREGERTARLAPARSVVVPAGATKGAPAVPWQDHTASHLYREPKPAPLSHATTALTGGLGQPISGILVDRYCATKQAARQALVEQWYPEMAGEQIVEIMRSFEQRCAERPAAHPVAAPPRQQWAVPAGEVAPPTTRSFIEEHPVWAVVDVASVAASAYHGYKRNQSIGWAIWWGLMGGVAPIITPAIAVAQGFGKRKKRK